MKISCKKFYRQEKRNRKSFLESRKTHNNFTIAKERKKEKNREIFHNLINSIFWLILS